ncbi:MAG: B12-binding domain-containing radical SAM protein [Planctomycetes bacterium]|nr:B12-binding domain-containing radical SAM protein [Planctomycetota bacterium]
MPHVAFVPFTGFRVREAELRALGVELPGLHDRAAALARLPALALLTLAGLTPPRWTCSHHELDEVSEVAIEEVLAARPDLVALSALTASVEEAYRASALLRARGARTVLGGLHATACPDEARAHVDAVVVGEGEPVWATLLEDAERGALRPVYRAGAPFDLARAPLPRLDLLGSRARPRFTLQTQRGCPLACEFCGASRLLGPFREKPAPLVARELAAIAARAPRPVIELADDNTFAGARDPGPLLEALAGAGARWFTEADWRLGERPALLRDLAAAGCVQVLVGLESLAGRPAGMGPKAAPLERVLDAARAIQDAGIAVIGCFIAGADGETRASLDRLAAVLREAPLADAQVTLVTPFPGTPLRRRLAREGRLLAERGWSHYTLFDVTFRPDRLGVEELERAFRELLRGGFDEGARAWRARIRRETWARNPSLRRSGRGPCSGS